MSKSKDQKMYKRLEVLEEQMSVVAKAIELLTSGQPKDAANEIAKIT